MDCAPGSRPRRLDRPRYGRIFMPVALLTPTTMGTRSGSAWSRAVRTRSRGVRDTREGLRFASAGVTGRVATNAAGDLPPVASMARGAGAARDPDGTSRPIGPEGGARGMIRRMDAPERARLVEMLDHQEGR